MTNKRKRTVLIVTVVALVALLAVGATLALLTDRGTVLNVLGIGQDASGKKTVDITLTEPQFKTQVESAIAANGANSGKVTSDADGNITKLELYDIQPNMEIRKDPTVTVTGSNGVYLRMKATLSDGSDAFVNTKLIELGLAPATGWVKNSSDNYYYYAASLTGTGNIAAKDAKVPIFKIDASNVSMKIPESWDYADVQAITAAGTNILDINVVAEAVQSQDYTPDISGNPGWVLSDGTTPVVASNNG